MTDQIPMDKLARVYRRIRDKIDEVTQLRDTEIDALKEQQDQIKEVMKEQMKALGVTSVNTPGGTVVMSVKTTYTTNDWDSFNSFVVEHDAVALFQKRIHQTNMKQFLDEHPGVVPPGLNSNMEYDISVRKPTK